MSKMPAKKKSCFQITSVTTAQVATSITEDTESLDDPDESRTEDVSSEIFDVSRATDYGPEEVCERSSSEETLNNVGEAETPGTVSPNPQPDGQSSVAPGTGRVITETPAQMAAAAAAAAAACSSRFRVIKLDHGSGEPYRRGRWTCMEYYDRDSDGGALARTGDCIRHGGAPVEQPAERDSGLGATGGSGAAGDPGPDPSSATPAPFLQAEMMGQAPPAQAHGPVMGQPPPASVPAGHDGKSGPPVQPGVPGLPQQVPPAGASAAQPPQPFAYPPPRLPVAHLPPGLQHVAAQQAAPAPSAAPIPSAGGARPAGRAGEAAVPGAGPGGQATPGAARPGGGPAGPAPSTPLPPSHQMGAAVQPAAMPGGPHPLVPGAQAGPSAPGASAAPVTMPNVPVTSAQPQMSGHASLGRGPGVVQHVGLPPAPGGPNVPTSLPPSNLSQFQTQTQPLAGQIDDTRRKSEPLPQPPLSLIAENKPLMKPLNPDALTNPLHLPATTPMNSLASSVFSISIPVDGDEDSASGASVVAIDNKIEQAMDLVKSHLMYAVREEVEVLKEQIKELIERNSLLERENALLKSLSNNDQLSQLSTQQANPGSTSQPQTVIAQPLQPTQPPQQPNVSSA
uniref:TSC22 domain family member 2 n=1 Tax=Ornithorhynchus anatinus TaxID=9258 RepID=A0A6I8MYL9_ORNAN